MEQFWFQLMNLSIAYLAQGKLYLKFHQAPVREFEFVAIVNG
ncbi:hypothetical protein [Fischerella sp.]|nr:hypothetical protein [Fischerella sp.]